MIGITAVSAENSDNADIGSDISASINDNSNSIEASTTTSSTSSSSHDVSSHASSTQSTTATSSHSGVSSTDSSVDKTTTSDTQSSTSSNAMSSSSDNNINTQINSNTTKSIEDTNTQQTQSDKTIKESSGSSEIKEVSNDNSLKEADESIDSKMTVSNKTIYYGENVQLVATVVNSETGEYVSGGNVGFKVNDVTVGYGNLTDGKAYYTYDSSSLAVKNYTITASYSGTSTVNPTTSSVGNLEVLKHVSDVSVSDKTVNMGDKVQLVATVVDRTTDEYATTGEVEFKINGVTIGYSNVSNGKAYLDYDSSSLQIDNYTISINYSGNSTINSNTSSGVLRIQKHPSVVSISNKTVMAGSQVQLVVTVVDRTTGEYATSGIVTFKVNGKTVGTSNVIDGKAYFDYDASELSAKTYTLTATYAGNDLISNNTTASDGQLIVQKHNASITVNSYNVYCGDTVEIVATIMDTTSGGYAKSGTVAFKINGKTVGYSDVTDGKAYYNYSTTDLSAKTYTISASYGGENIYNDDKTDTNGTLVVNKHTTQMTVSNKTVYAGNQIQLVATVYDRITDSYATSGTVAFKVNGKTVGYGNISNGKAYYTYDASSLSAKNYTLSASYGGTNTVASAKTTVDGQLTVLKHSVSMTISNKTAYKNNNVQLVITVFDNTSNKYVTSGKVAFKVNGKTVGYGNLSNGKAYYTYNTSKLNVGTYSLSASYGGSSTLNSATANGSTLELSLRPVVMTISNKTVMPGTKSVQLVVTVVDQQTGKYATGGNVLFKVGGVTVGNSTLKDGKAYLVYNFSSIAGRSYTLNATYQGTITYASAKTTTPSYLNVSTLIFTYDEIKDAAVYLRNHYEANDIITKVPIGSITIGVEDFLPMMIQMVMDIDQGNGSNTVEYVDYGGVSSQSDTISTTTLSMSVMINIGSNVLEFYKENGRAPRYATVNSQQIGFYNLVYSYAKILDLSEIDSLPSTCTVYKWSTIHPSSSTARTIYLTSDVIYNSDRDMAFMNSIKTELEKRGYNVVISSYGSNAHNTVIRAESLPENAVQVSIFGGADAGVIYDVCTRSYMRAKANRLVFFVYYPTATDITGLSWLPRAHDDNYSPSNFTGIAHPDEYLKEHGYDYVYSSSVNTIVDAIIKYIS